MNSRGVTEWEGVTRILTAARTSISGPSGLIFVLHYVMHNVNYWHHVLLWNVRAEYSHDSYAMNLNSGEIAIRELEADHEMRLCEDLQGRIWGNSPREIVPHYVFVVARHIGGQVLGAFDGTAIIGFLLAFPGVHQNEIYLHSHMTGVLREYQGIGIGTRLKLAQRSNAISRGIDLVEWTFDPLQLGNANFNIVRLGAIVRQYVPNIYGQTTSRLDSGLPTDRLVAEWWIRASRVERILNGSPSVATEHSRRIRLPRRIREICLTDPNTARKIQKQLHRELDELFQQSFAITGFEWNDEYGSFILEHYDGCTDRHAKLGN